MRNNYAPLSFDAPSLFSEVARSQSAKPARKENLTRNSQSRSFKGMHFWITERPISPYNNAGLVSQLSEKIAIENAKNYGFDNPTVVWRPHRGTSANILTNLIPPETRDIDLHFAANSMGLSSFNFFLWWAPKDASFLQQSAYRPFRVVQGRWFWHHESFCNLMLVISNNAVYYHMTNLYLDTYIWLLSSELS